jgi:hypothetical protein
MRRLSDHEIHILSVVAKHETICIGVPIDEQWAPIATTLERLSRPNPGMLIRQDFDDGPTYSLSSAGRAKLGE